MFEGPVQDLIDELGRLPGVGPKSAQRIAFHLLAAEPADVSRLQDVLQKVKQGVQFCEVCGNVAAAQRCRFCSDARRDPTLVCVVEEPKDVLAVERTREFKGRYHVLGGALDPLAGVGPDSLRPARRRFGHIDAQKHVQFVPLIWSIRREMVELVNIRRHVVAFKVFRDRAI